jgi:hypothetical protein
MGGVEVELTILDLDTRCELSASRPGFTPWEEASFIGEFDKIIFKNMK